MCLRLIIITALIGLVTGGLTAAQERPAVPMSGSIFQSLETRALQFDDATNPAMLWVEQGQSLWMKSEGTAGTSCASCHGDLTASMKGVAARYPAIDPKSKTLLNVEERINACRIGYQQSTPLSYESNELIALTTAVAYQSRGTVRSVQIEGAAKAFFDQGRAFFETRQGQLNLACSQCHDEQAGSKLRGDTISQGQTHGWPAYRLEWQSIGSLQRRLRACSLGVRAELLPFGAPEYIALELYLAWRGGSLPMESPGVRR
jgi:L-cysteine S-thiosulfotransferase